MAQVQKSVVTLRICGDDLVPEEITRMLGVPPTYSQTKDEKLIGRKSGLVRIAKFGMWSLDTLDRDPEDINGQIHEILSRTTNDLAIWRNITGTYQADLFCGLFLSGGNEGLTLSPQSLAALGERGIEMGVDIYSGDEDDDESAEPVIGAG